MPDLREPLTATHVHPETGRGVNTPDLFRSAFNSALFSLGVLRRAKREKETDRTEPSTCTPPSSRVYRWFHGKKYRGDTSRLQSRSAPRSCTRRNGFEFREVKSERKVKKSVSETLALSVVTFKGFASWPYM